MAGNQRRLELLGPGPHRWRGGCWWDHLPLPEGADQPPTRLRYGCGRHGQHRRTLNQLRGPVRGAAGIVKLAALEAAYTKAVERGDREILLPL